MMSAPGAPGAAALEGTAVGAAGVVAVALEPEATASMEDIALGVVPGEGAGVVVLVWTLE